MSMDEKPTPALVSPSRSITPRKLLGGGLLLLVAGGVVNFTINTVQTKTQLGLVASKDPAEQQAGIARLMERKVLFDALQGGAPPATRLAAIAALAVWQALA